MRSQVVIDPHALYMTVVTQWLEAVDHTKIYKFSLVLRLSSTHIYN